MTYNLRFSAGDLLIVTDNFKYFGNGVYRAGPRVPGHVTAQMRDFKSGEVFLAISGVKKSSWKDNRQLYLEVMTSAGPRLAWARCFKMKKKEF